MCLPASRPQPSTAVTIALEAALDVLGHTTRDLPFADDDEVRAVLLQVVDLGVGMRPRDDLQTRIGDAAMLDEIAVLERIWNGADQPARRGDVRCLDKPRLTGISRNDLDPSRPQPIDHLLTLLDHQQWLARVLQHLADEAPDTPVADEDGVAGKRRGRQFRGRRGRRLRGPPRRNGRTPPPLALPHPRPESSTPAAH